MKVIIKTDNIVEQLKGLTERYFDGVEDIKYAYFKQLEKEEQILEKQDRLKKIVDKEQTDWLVSEIPGIEVNKDNTSAKFKFHITLKKMDIFKFLFKRKPYDVLVTIDIDRGVGGNCLYQADICVYK